ncbi:MAG: hypothetical protein Q9M16_10500 [Mariprofundus sp.]|nr:hypothetical protein [Mariprofundus sp.]
MGGTTPGMALDGGAGGIQPDFSSSAASGDATTGSNSVYVGGFNPPLFPVMGSTNQSILIVGVVLLAGWWIYKKR